MCILKFILGCEVWGNKGGVTRDDSQRRFLAQHSVATLLRHCFGWLQHCSNIATLYCAKNRRCESSRVTSPLKQKKSSCGSIMNNTFLLFYSSEPRSQVWILIHRVYLRNWSARFASEALNKWNVNFRSICRLKPKISEMLSDYQRFWNQQLDRRVTTKCFRKSFSRINA